ncbi:MAG: hypothetical protein QOE93_949 [Actinomycetota bacterium]|jgi:hypothetical protein|nr:hypothetical protein [Actinomycetota bacterium]
MPILDGRMERGRLGMARLEALRRLPPIAWALVLLLLLPGLVRFGPLAARYVGGHVPHEAVDTHPAPTPVTTAPTESRRATVVFTVTVPPIPTALDLLPVIDLTGSYSSSLVNVTRLLPELQRSLATKSDLRVGLASFMDDPCCGGERDDYPYRLDLPLTNSPSSLGDALGRLRAGDGGDNRESWLHAVDRAVKDAGFRDGASRIVLLSTDNDSHHRGDGSGSAAPTLDEVANSLRATGIRVIALLPRDHDAGDAVELAKRTGGSVQFVERSSSDLDRAIRAGLKAVHVDIEPVIRDGCPIDEAAFDPPRFEQVAAGTSAEVRLAYVAHPTTAPGEAPCTVDFGPAGTQSFEVKGP